MSDSGRITDSRRRRAPRSLVTTDRGKVTPERRTQRTVPRAFFVAFGGVVAVLLASFGALALSQVPGEVYIRLPGRWGAGPDLGSLPALPVAILLFLGAISAAGWALFVGTAPWRYRRLMVWFPPVAYLVIMTAALVLFIVDDPTDTGRIFVVVLSILLLSLFTVGVTKLPPSGARQAEAGSSI